MPLPATWHTLPHVGCAGRKRPGRVACAHTQVRGLLRGGRTTQRHPGNRLRAEIQCGILPALPGIVAQASLPRQTLGIGVGQREIPPRPRTPTLVEAPAQTPHALVLAPIQARDQPDRTRLETYATSGNPQSTLPNPREHHGCCVRALQIMGEAKSAVGQAMRHYLRRCV